MNGSMMYPSIWKMASRLVQDSILVSTEEISTAVRLLLYKNKILAEGAGASSVAAAMTEQIPSGKIVCIISGGNIDEPILKKILNGETP